MITQPALSKWNWKGRWIYNYNNYWNEYNCSKQISYIVFPVILNYWLVTNITWSSLTLAAKLIEIIGKQCRRKLDVNNTCSFCDIFSDVI